jgi:hypothetical protein
LKAVKTFVDALSGCLLAGSAADPRGPSSRGGHNRGDVGGGWERNVATRDKRHKAFEH